jgi:hypothetical protein
MLLCQLIQTLRDPARFGLAAVRVGDRTDLRTLCRDRILYRVGRQTLYTLQSICHALGAQLCNIFIYRFDQWHPQSLQRIIHEFYWHSIFTPSTNNWLTQIIHILVLRKWHQSTIVNTKTWISHYSYCFSHFQSSSYNHAKVEFLIHRCWLILWPGVLFVHMFSHTLIIASELWIQSSRFPESRRQMSNVSGVLPIGLGCLVFVIFFFFPESVLICFKTYFWKVIKFRIKKKVFCVSPLTFWRLKLELDLY